MKKALIPLTAVLFLGGIILFLYPTVSNWLSARHHSSAIQEYNEIVGGLDSVDMEVELRAAQAYNNQLTGGSIEDPFIPGSGMVLPDNYTSVLNVGGSMGYIQIPKINVSLPIYHGTGEDVLKKGVGHLDATALPVGGAGNHCVLTGHRGLSSAKLFTDLDRVEEGDIFYLHVLDDMLAYQVDQIKVIEPTDTEDLRPAADMDYVTLITCTPYAVNSHRLLVRGVRVPYSVADTEEIFLMESSLAGMRLDTITVIRICAIAGVLLLTVLLFLLSGRTESYVLDEELGVWKEIE